MSKIKQDISFIDDPSPRTDTSRMRCKLYTLTLSRPMANLNRYTSTLQVPIPDIMF